MRFEEHELKPCAEMVSTGGLRVDMVYFAVNFVDDEMLIPIMEPKVFIGRDLDSDHEDRLYFQDIGSYRRGVRFDSATDDDEATFESGTERHIFEYEKALDELLRCSLRRKPGPSDG